MQNPKKTKIIVGIVSLFVVLLLVLFLFGGDNKEILVSLFGGGLTREEVQERLSEFGMRGYITVIILSMMQVVISFLPAEPVQVVAGIAFGFPIGILLCTIGVLLGNTVIYILYRIYGERLQAYFDKKLDIDINAVGASGKVTLVIFVLYFLPAIPYGMICFLAATLGMKYHRYITVTLLGAIPSVMIGVGLGHMAMASSLVLAIVVFAVLMALLLVLLKNKERVFKWVNAWIAKGREPYSSKTKVRKYHPFFLEILYIGSRILFFFKGVRLRYIRKVKTLDTPCVVLVNHGAFVDFAYAGTLLRKYAPNFIVNRMYFYRRDLGNLLRFFGCFPKSMFTLDIESAKNCLGVIKSGGVLAMMPEARLSTAGSFEDIQPGTYAFLKKLGVPVYTVKICGDYLAKPKWGRGIRRGALVEATLDLLFTKEELSGLREAEIGTRVEAALRYDELAWLETNPKIKYRCRHIAEGLENILTYCPKCGSSAKMTTKGNKISCEACGASATVDHRYRFRGDFPYENFAKMYEAQCDRVRNAIEKDAEYTLSSNVTLMHSSFDGKRMLRFAGEGVCTLRRDGLTYIGTRDGERVEKHFSMSVIYRLLFGAGEDFELYEGRELWYFIPEDKRRAVDFYIASKIFKDRANGGCNNG